MSWIKAKPQAPAAPLSVSAHMARQSGRHREPHVDPATELRLAEFLVKHGRLAPRSGRPALQLLGTLKNHDETVDYSVRTRVRHTDGTTKTFDSHIREYPGGTRRMRLIR
jgi:hypothetical protein